jgi:hypothetical protein
MLESLNGLANLYSIGGSLIIGDYYGGNPSLTNLAGLGNLTSIGDEISIHNNPVLPNLAGLDNVTSIGGDISVKFNGALTDLMGLRNIASNSIESLFISNNPSLCKCAVESICDFLDSSIGLADFHLNASGCNDRQEVELACLSISVEELVDEGEKVVVRCVPNPINSIANIYLNLPDAAYVNIQICDITGRKITHLFSGILQPGQQQFTWDARDFDGGVYFLKVENDGLYQVKKLLLIE